jgi:hypothetical protein
MPAPAEVFIGALRICEEHGMIRPVLYVDLPGIIYAIDRRARARNSEFANFVCLPEREEPRSTLSAILSNLLPINPAVRTWLCEDHWRMLGVAQVRRRPNNTAWDMTYLASLPHRSANSEDVLLELLEYVVNTAILHGVQRIFARIDDEAPELELFSRVLFQRYARELIYYLDPAALEPAHLERLTAPMIGKATMEPDLPLRRWHRHDEWGLLRLYHATTPHRVQTAELLTDSAEYAWLRGGPCGFWSRLLGGYPVDQYVCDLGVRLGGWLQVRRFGRREPGQLALMVHPDNADLIVPLLQYGLRLLWEGGRKPVYCQVREYETHIIAALRSQGFEHIATRALLVRHLTIRALQRRFAPSFEYRVIYGVKGWGIVTTRLYRGDETYYATGDH